jgi:arylsulfatase
VSNESSHDKHQNNQQSRGRVNRRNMLLAGTSVLAAAGLLSTAQTASAQAQPRTSAQAPTGGQRPNILVIWGDDIGQFNISAYNQGMMGYRTPNIDSIAKEGALFTDWYGQQSCTAGRAAFITGQSPIRTGLTKVGLPGAPEGLTKADPTIAELLKPLGYVTGQFGKNHLGDRNDMLPTVHGFDEWFGNLYHLNAEEEPENVDYPKDPAFKAKFGPRGVLHAFASDKDDPTDDPRFGKVGKQTIRDTGPLTRKRMETIDEEVTVKTIEFMERAKRADKPFFIWWNSSRMHVFTHLKAESKGKTGLGTYADGMVEHDGHVGQVLAKLKALGLDDNTIVMYSTDNGAEFFNWPDGGSTMFRGEKNTQWEGGFRVPCMIRWPGVIKPGTVINDIGAHEDLIPTLLAAAGDTTVKEDLLKGRKIGDMTYKVHLDGYNLLPFFRGDVKQSPRREFIYWTDGGSVAALRYDNWKISFLRQNSVGIKVWEAPFEELRWPMLTNLRMDPFERASDESTGHPQWAAERMFALAPAGAYVGQWLASFREFPPRMKPGSFSLDRVMEAMTKADQRSN